MNLCGTSDLIYAYKFIVAHLAKIIENPWHRQSIDPLRGKYLPRRPKTQSGVKFKFNFKFFTSVIINT